MKTLRRVPRADLPADAQGRLRVFATGFEALAADSYGVARDAARLATELVPSQEREPFDYQARFLTEEVDRAEAAYARLPAAAKAADAATGDRAANAARGLFTCLVKNDWARGLEFLRAAGEPWQSIAEREAKRPAGAADREALGNMWCKAAEQLPAPDAAGARQRAGHWYLGALSQLGAGADTFRANDWAPYWYLPGVAKIDSSEREAAAARLQPRIDQVPRTPITLRVRMTRLSGFHDLRISSDGVRTSSRGGRKITGDIHVNHLRWGDHVEGHHNSGAGRLLPDGIDFSTARLVRMSHGGGGAVRVSQTPEFLELAFWHSPGNGQSDFDLTLEVESAGHDLPSRFTRQWDVAYYNWPETMPPTDAKAREALFQGVPADRVKMSTVNFVSESSPTDGWRPGTPPSKQVGADRYAMVATSTWQLPAGRYQVRAYADDGARVLIDGRVALDHWNTKGDFHARSDDFRLAAGSHQIRVEHHQITGSAILQFDLVRLGD